MSAEVYKRKKNIQLEPLYHSGKLLVKYGNKAKFKPYYGELRGTTLFLFKIMTQENYSEKLNLEKLKSKDLPCPYMAMAPTIFTLSFGSTVVQLQMDEPRDGELWRGYLLTMAERRISRKLMLPQSVIMELEQALENENTRPSAEGGPRPPPRPEQKADGAGYQHLHMPECFIDVTRMEAEKMLEVCHENGNLIIRPSRTNRRNYAVTMRLTTPRGPDIQHFVVTPKGNRFVIDMAPPKEVRSMQEVVNYFVEETKNKARPYGTGNYSKTINLDQTQPKETWDRYTRVFPGNEREFRFREFQRTTAAQEEDDDSSYAKHF